MKKTLLLTVVFSLILGLAVVVKADDVLVSTDQATVNVTDGAVTVNTDQVAVNTTSDAVTVDTDQVAVKTTEEAVVVSTDQVVVKTDGLEKIPSPAEIKNFGQIIKKGAALWGVRKKEMKQEEKKKATEEKKGESLEKIASPSEIRYFKNIRKVGTALWGIRKEVRAKELKKIETGSVSCVKEAINAKDASLKAAFNVYSQKFITILDARNACQNAALDSADQLAANKLCANVYQKEVRISNETVGKARDKSWKTYTEKLKECVKSQVTSVSAPEVLNLEDGGNAAVAAQL